MSGESPSDALAAPSLPEARCLPGPFPSGEGFFVAGPSPLPEAAPFPEAAHFTEAEPLPGPLSPVFLGEAKAVPQPNSMSAMAIGATASSARKKHEGMAGLLRDGFPGMKDPGALERERGRSHTSAVRAAKRGFERKAAVRTLTGPAERVTAQNIFTFLHRIRKSPQPSPRRKCFRYACRARHSPANYAGTEEHRRRSAYSLSRRVILKPPIPPPESWGERDMGRTAHGGEAAPASAEPRDVAHDLRKRFNGPLFPGSYKGEQAPPRGIPRGIATIRLV